MSDATQLLQRKRVAGRPNLSMYFTGVRSGRQGASAFCASKIHRGRGNFGPAGGDEAVRHVHPCLSGCERARISKGVMRSGHGANFLPRQEHGTKAVVEEKVLPWVFGVNRAVATFAVKKRGTLRINNPCCF